MNSFRKWVIVAMTCTPFLGTASAQDAGWEYTISPYFWVPGIASSVPTRFGTLEAEASVGDVLSATDFALMGMAEARRGRWGLIADFVYADLSERQDTPFGTQFSRATVNTELRIASAYAAYRVHETAQLQVDIVGGLRAVSADIGVRLTSGTLPGQSFGLSDSWVDPVAGGRVRFALNDRWSASAMADFGGSGGGSDRTWQAIATIGYQINDRWSVQGGWRHMSIDRKMGTRDVEIDLGGPVLGLTARF